MDRNNVVPIRADIEISPRPALSAEIYEFPAAAPPARPISRRGAASARHALFLILYWARPFARLLIALVAGAAALAQLVLWMQMKGEHPGWWILSFVITSFAHFALRLAYDRLILRLAPDTIWLRFD